MQAMILAAGFGTRLLPHTRLRPKPLFPLLGKPLLLLTIERLQAFGFKRIVVNCHYLAEQIKEAVAPYGVIVQQEEKVLGTGGGLRRAMTHFTNEPVLVTNGDIYHTLDFTRLYQYHKERENKVTLAMHNYPRFNKVVCDGRRICHFAEEGKRAEKRLQKLAYTGIQVIEPEILRDIDPDAFSCIISHYKNILAQGEILGCFRADAEPFFWTDMGTPEDYLALHGCLLTGDVPCWEQLIRPESAFYVADDAAVKDGELRQWAAVGSGVSLGAGCSVTRSVIWDGIKVAAGAVVTDSLISGVADE